MGMEKEKKMDFLNSWLQGIVVAVIITTIIELILPEGNNKKHIKVVLGVYVVFNIIAPIINKFSNSNFEMSSLINIDKYAKEIETYNANSSNIYINETNDESIKQIYISNLKNDIKAKLEEKKYETKNIDITMSNTENYDIEKIEIYLKNEDEQKGGNDNKKENKITQNQIKINEVEKIDIEIASK